jgi:hypothetical protein
MTFTTLTYNSVEKCLADWGINAATREVSNQAHDHFACDVIMPFDATDPLPYGAQITLQIGRTPGGGTGLTAGGLPISGNTNWTAGKIWFVGYRVENFRTGHPDLEKFEYKFAGPWEFFFERLVFQKLWWTWNGTENVADYRSQIILGESVNALVGAGDTVPNSNATNLMSIRQQVAEIIAYVIQQTTTDYGSPQLQSDDLTSAIDGVNYDLYATPGTNIIIPDYIPGYAVSGQTSASALTTKVGGTGQNLINVVLRAPLESVNDITCAEALRRQLRWVGPFGSPVIWFDYTTSPPTLHVCTKDQLPSVNLPAPIYPGNSATPCAGLRIKRRDDLIPSAIALKFRVTGTFGGQQYVQIISDIAATIGGTQVEGVGLTGQLFTAQTFATASPAYVGGSANSATMQALEAAGRDFASAIQTIDMEGNKFTTLTGTIVAIPVDITTPSGAGTANAQAFWRALFPELNDMTNVDFYSGGSVSVVDDSNTAIDLSTFQYLLTRGQIAPWMQNAGALSIRAHVTASFLGLENNSGITTSIANNHVKHATVTLCSVTGGNYASQQLSGVGEVIPYGLAGYIYNVEKIPQYEGAFTIQETEITDQCPLGSNLNLTGSLAEWSTMTACVQQLSYDLAAGRTTLTFGPAGHLGPKDFVERLRVNRGPRWYNLNGNNVTNAADQNGSQALGQDTAQMNPQPGPKRNGYHFLSISEADLAAHGSAYTNGFPGAVIDNRSSGQPNYGNFSVPTGTPAFYAPVSSPVSPTVFVAGGSGGTLGGAVRMNIDDLYGKQVWFQEMPCYFNFNDGNGCVAAYVMALCSFPYKTSVHA